MGELTPSDIIIFDSQYYQRGLDQDRALSEAERIRRWEVRLRFEELADEVRSIHWSITTHTTNADFVSCLLHATPRHPRTRSNARSRTGA